MDSKAGMTTPTTTPEFAAAFVLLWLASVLSVLWGLHLWAAGRCQCLQ